MNVTVKRLINELSEDIVNAFNIEIPIVNIDNIVSRIGGYVVIDDTLSGYSDGSIQKDGDSFKIVISPYQSETRRNFTIAHELGHLFLHMGYKIDNELWEKQDERTYYRNGSSIEEYEANEFAAALLMPEKEYKIVLDRYTNEDIVDTYSIANYFNVSINAATNRGRFLGYLQW